MRLPTDPLALAAALPDLPRWVETRSLLQTGEFVLTVNRAGDAALVVDTRFPSGALIGRADRWLLRDGLAEVPDDLELIVQMDALDGARDGLPDWDVAFVTVHLPARPVTGADPVEPGVIVSAPPEQRWLEHVPEDVRRYAGDAHARVWAADQDNAASMHLAAKLGFRAVDRLAVLSRGAA